MQIYFGFTRGVPAAAYLPSTSRINPHAINNQQSTINNKSAIRNPQSAMLKTVAVYASFGRFSHAVFELPFALAGALLASRHVAVTWTKVGWILVAMVSARSAAMGFNRLADARLDALNPRTAARELPRGAMSRREATAFVVMASAVFVYAAYRLNPLCFALSPVALAIVFWYSLAKRYTTWTQLFLGLAMAVAPVGGWLAAGGRDGWEPWLLALAIGAWVGGFDVLYACQDVEFDRAHALRSIPVRFGVRTALWISRAMHVMAVVGLLALSWVTPLPWLYDAGGGAAALRVGYEQSLFSAGAPSPVK